MDSTVGKGEGICVPNIRIQSCLFIVDIPALCPLIGALFYTHAHKEGSVSHYIGVRCRSTKNTHSVDTRLYGSVWQCMAVKGQYTLLNTGRLFTVKSIPHRLGCHCAVGASDVSAPTLSLSLSLSSLLSLSLFLSFYSCLFHLIKGAPGGITPLKMPFPTANLSNASCYLLLHDMDG